MWLEIVAIWGCVPEFTKDCLDMTNASSTYLSILIGVVIGSVISWWIYNIQKRTSEKQDNTLKHVRELEESHERLLRSIQQFQERQEKLLIDILGLDRKIDFIIESRK
jgi:hypothetical protein